MATSLVSLVKTPTACPAPSAKSLGDVASRRRRVWSKQMPIANRVRAVFVKDCVGCAIRNASRLRTLTVREVRHVEKKGGVLPKMTSVSRLAMKIVAKVTRVRAQGDVVLKKESV